MVPVRRVGLVGRAPRHGVGPGGAARGTVRPCRPPVGPGHGRPRRGRRRPGAGALVGRRHGRARRARRPHRRGRAAGRRGCRLRPAPGRRRRAGPAPRPGGPAARGRARPPRRAAPGAGQRRLPRARPGRRLGGGGLVVDRHRGADRARPAAPAPGRRRRGARGPAAPAARHGARGADQPHRGVVHDLDAVLDDPRLRGAARELLGQHGLRARLPRAAARPLGPARHRRLRDRGDVAGARRSRRPDPARHPRRQRRRVRRAAGDDDQPRLRGRHQPVRRRGPGGPGGRDAQVRVPLPRPAGRPVAGGRVRLPRAVADPPRRPAARRAAPAPGRRRHGRATGPGPRHGRGHACGRPRGRAERLPGRGSRVPPGRVDRRRPDPRGRVLPAGAAPRRRPVGD